MHPVLPTLFCKEGRGPVVQCKADVWLGEASVGGRTKNRDLIIPVLI